MLNEDILFVAQMRSYFSDTPEFFMQCMDQPGGLLTWLSLWLTQLFYHPWLGIAALVFLWTIIFLTLKMAFRVKMIWTPLLLIPVACLIAADCQLGYWIYYLKFQGYYFHPTLGVLSVALLVWLSASDNRIAKYGGIALAALAYPLIGFYSPLALACTAIMALSDRKWIDTAIAVAAAIAAPVLWTTLYDSYNTDDTFTIGIPIFRSSHYVNEVKSYPFYGIIIALLLFTLLHKLPKLEIKSRKALFILAPLYVAILAGCTAIVKTSDYSDEAFQTECKVYRAIDEERWDDALDAVARIKCDITRELIVMKNIALFNKGNIGNEMYNYPDDGIHPKPGDSLRVCLANTAGPLIYLHHGLINYAYRWAMENSVEQGLNIAHIKVLATAAAVNGEKALSQKYVNMLQHTLYYKDWKMPDTKKMSELYKYENELAGSDNGLIEKFLIDYFSIMPPTTSKYLTEMSLAYALMSKDIKTFWTQFFRYAAQRPGLDMPIHYQEAAYLYGKLEPQTVDSSHMPYNKERIIDRYAQFMQTATQYMQSGMDEHATGEAMRSQYSDTFWWTYYFVHGSTYY